MFKIGKESSELESMSQSTTDGHSTQTPVQCTQNDSQIDTYDQRLPFNYPDRQDEVIAESTDESFAADSVSSSFSSSLGVSLNAPHNVSHNVSHNASHHSPQTTRTFTEEEIQKVKDDIAEMNQRFMQHGYEAFVHKKMHLIFKVYPFDLE